MSKFQGVKSFLVDVTSPRERRLGEQFAFGHRETIIHSLNLDAHTFFLGTLQHGWIDNTFGANRPRVFGKNGKPYVDLVWSRRGFEEMRKAGRKSVFPIGAPWAYLIKNIERRSAISPIKNGNQTKTFTYFPSHSHHGWETAIHANSVFFDANEYKRRICLYWLDYLKVDLRKSLEESGWEVVCAGFRGSSGNEIPWEDVGGRSTFLLNLWTILDSSDLIICDDVASAFWYSLAIRKPTILARTQSYFNTWNSSDLRNPVRYVQDNKSILNRYGISYNFDGSPLNTRGELTELGRFELGWECTEDLDYRSRIIDRYSTIDDRIPEKYVENFREKFSELIKR